MEIDLGSTRQINTAGDPKKEPRGRQNKGWKVYSKRPAQLIADAGLKRTIETIRFTELRLDALRPVDRTIALLTVHPGLAQPG
jgi:hypothetical protein